MKCISLRNQECKVKKVIIDNGYMTFPYKIKVDRCDGSFNDKDNPYFKVCLPDSVKNGSFGNVVNCSCEFKKVAKLIVEKKECDVKIDGIVQNKTITLIKKIESCKPFVASSILFVSDSIIFSGIMIYFCIKSRNRDVLPYQNDFY